MPWRHVISIVNLGNSNCKVLDNITACSVWATTFPPLQWRHNEHNGVLNHQPHHCLLNRLFRQLKENIKAPRHWPLCGEFTGDRWPVNSPHKWPVTRKMFPLMTSSWSRGNGSHGNSSYCSVGATGPSASYVVVQDTTRRWSQEPVAPLVTCAKLA